MGKAGLLKKALALIVSIAMVVTMVPQMAMEAKADTYGTLVNGDFSTSTASDNAEGWTFTGFVVANSDWMATGYESYKNQNYLKAWAESSTDISLSQTIENVELGEYVLSVNVGGPHDAGLAMITVKSGETTLTSKAIPAGSGWGVWSTVQTDSFEITDSNNDSITVSISGKVGVNASEESAESEIDIDNVAITPADSTGSSDRTVTFNYYVGDTEDEVGLYYYGSNLTSTANATSWKVWSNDPYPYLMTENEDYPGWYSVPITFSNDGADSGFQVYKQSNAGTTSCEYKSDAWSTDESYEEYTTGTETVYAVKSGVIYAGTALSDAVMRSVRLHVFDYDGVPAIGTTSQLKKINSSGTALETLEETAEDGGVYYYQMTADGAIGDNWYTLEFVTPDPADTTNIIGSLYSYADSAYSLVTTFVESSTVSSGQTSFKPVFSGKNYYVSGELLDAVPMTIGDLNDLLTEARNIVTNNTTTNLYNEEDASWGTMTSQISATETFMEENETSPKTLAQIKTRYEALEASIKGLVTNPIENDYLNVERVAIDDDFITGADISSFYALRQAGTVFSDEAGTPLSDQEFFSLLKEGGTNWVRIRVWNNPYNGTGKGYGGGNSDIAKAVALGKLATNAGMRVLIDFHYSDFWADPGKQKVPDAWADMELDEKTQAVETFTYNSLKTLLNAGVDVGMVQTGNETNNGVCGETISANMCAIFSAGSRAVRQIETEYERDILVAVHYANPEKGKYPEYAAYLNANEVDYDVFASSYYPYWHGTINNLKTTLGTIATTYNKKVMVAETSWASSLGDGDGHENTVREGNNDTAGSGMEYYDFSIQGQATELRTVVNAINDTTGGIGVFYWEPAWISPKYVYDDDGNVVDSLLNANKTAWETYGAGWASSYSAAYDPDDAGVYFGGSPIDNQSWFGFDGKALPTVNTYKYIRIGAVNTSPVSISYVKNKYEASVNIGDEVDLDTISNSLTVNPTFSDGDLEREYSVTYTWDEDDVNAISTWASTDCTVHGVMHVSYCYVYQGNTVNTTQDINIKLVLHVLTTSNVLLSPGFENSTDNNAWSSSDPELFKIDGETPRTGSKCGHFYSSVAMNDPESPVRLSQIITGFNTGTYTAGIFIQGGGASADDRQKLIVNVYDSNEQLKNTYSKETALSGWKNWQNPEITGIVAENGDIMEFIIEIYSSVGGAWGTVDDCYLYGRYAINTNSGSGGSITLSGDEPVDGDIVAVSVTPSTNYTVDSIVISGSDLLINNNEDLIASDLSGVTKEHELSEDIQKIILSCNTSDAVDFLIIMPPAGITIEASYTYNGPVTPTQVDATGIQLTPTSLTLEEKKTGNLKASVLPVNQTELTSPVITWTSSNPFVATVSDGIVTAVKDGTAIITASVTAKGGTFTASCAVRVMKEIIIATGLTVTPSTAEVGDMGQTALYIYYAPENQNENPAITWTSSDEKVATVAYGVVTAVSEGTVTITASATNAAGTALTATAEVTIKGHNENPDLVVEGFNEETLKATVTATCPICKGQHFNGELTAVDNKDGSYTFTFTSDLDKKSYSVKWVNHEHEWAAPVWNWTGKDDVSAAFTCTVGKETKNVRASVTLIRTNSKGDSKYKATVIGPDEKPYESTQWYDKDGKPTSGEGIGIEGIETEYEYTGKAIKPEPIVRDYATDAILVKGTDYSVSYSNNTRVGTATITVKGKGNYGAKGGEATATFKITDPTEGEKAEDYFTIKSVKVTSKDGFTYTGEEKFPATLTIKTSDGDVTATWNGLDYDLNVDSTKEMYILVSNNVNKGSGVVAVTGNKGNGTFVTKTATFAIKACDLSTAGDNLNIDARSVAWSVKGAKAKVEVTFMSETLVEGRDYTLDWSYLNKKNAGTGAGKVIVKGKNNFTKKAEQKFDITPFQIKKVDSVAAYAGLKASAIKVTLYDGEGVVIPAKNYSVETKVYSKEGLEIADKKYKLQAGDNIYVTVRTASGNLDGEETLADIVVGANLAKAKITVPKSFTKTFTGEPIELTKDDFGADKITVGNYTFGEDFEIIGYQNNIKKGTMTVFIQGKGDKCSGINKIKVKIVPQKVKKAQ